MYDQNPSCWVCSTARQQGTNFTWIPRCVENACFVPTTSSSALIDNSWWFVVVLSDCVDGGKQHPRSESLPLTRSNPSVCRSPRSHQVLTRSASAQQPKRVHRSTKARDQSRLATGEGKQSLQAARVLEGDQTVRYQRTQLLQARGNTSSATAQAHKRTTMRARCMDPMLPGQERRFSGNTQQHTEVEPGFTPSESSRQHTTTRSPPPHAPVQTPPANSA